MLTEFIVRANVFCPHVLQKSSDTHASNFVIGNPEFVKQVSSAQKNV
jgi:hypothetical protein